MFGLKELSLNRLTTAFMVVSAALLVLGLALVPADGASISTLVLWIAGAIVLLGVWVVVAVEIWKRRFGADEGR